MQNTQDVTATLSDDIKFLITCCKTELSEDDITFIIQSIQHPSFNIQHLLSLANQHGILPLVYKTLKNLSKENASPRSLSLSKCTQYSTFKQLLSELKVAYTNIVQRNMLMSAELIHIMKLLEDHGIEALAFKGPTLSQMAYGDITLRQYSDLDILVEEKDLYCAAKLIVNQNYEPMNSIEFLKNKAKLHVEKNYEFYDKKHGIKVEIHWRLLNASFWKKFKEYDVFTTQQYTNINHTTIPTLNTKILLLYLCNHGASHMWERLGWIVDIDRLIKSEGDSFNWVEIMTLASSLQSRITLLLGLGLSQALFNTKLPSEIEKQVNTQTISNLIAFVLDTLNSNLINQDYTSSEKNFKIFQFNLALHDSFSSKTNFIFHTLFGYSDRDVMMVNLPKSLYFLYYPLRMIRIIKKYIFKN